MNRNLTICFFIIVFSNLTIAFAQYSAPGSYPKPLPTSPYATPIKSNPVPSLPTSLSSGAQYYEGNLDGLNEYMETLRENDKSLYGTLEKDLEKLNSSQSNARIWGWSLFGIGLVAAGTGVYLASKSNSNGEISGPNSIIAYGGLGLIVAAPFAYMALSPGKKELRSFINKHNRINKSNPLKIEIGIILQPEISGAGIALKF